MTYVFGAVMIGFGVLMGYVTIRDYRRHTLQVRDIEEKIQRARKGPR